MRNIIKKWNRPGDVFLLVAILNLLILFVMLLASNGQFLKEIIWDARNSLFPDFSAHVKRVAGGRNPYQIDDWDARFPPFAYMFYYIMSCIIPSQIPDSKVSDWYNLYMAILLCVCVVCIVLTINAQMKRSYLYVLALSLVFILSEPFAFAEIKAGNSATYVLTLLILALYLKDSESALAREAALILIAFAAGFKVVPAIMGLLYVKEKRWKETIRLIIYGIICFFAPFALFGAGGGTAS